MKKRTSTFFLSLLLILGCQADPADKLIPKLDKVLVDKSFNDVSFNPAVDILFIIDDSGSMSSYQSRLAENAQLFIDQFLNTKFIDYHIGVTSSSTSYSYSLADDGKLSQFEGYNFVSRQTPDAAFVLANLMKLGTRGDATEEFLSIPALAFSPVALLDDKLDYYRPDAHLAIFVLTDTEDQSKTSPPVAYDFLKSLKRGNERTLHYAAAIIEKDDVQKKCISEYDQPVPNRIMNLVKLHKERGYKFDLCKQDYGSDLAKVAKNLIRAASTVYLEQLPDITTLQVSYGDYIIPNDPDEGWVYDPDENAILLSPNIDIRDPKPAKLNIKFESIY